MKHPTPNVSNTTAQNGREWSYHVAVWRDVGYAMLCVGVAGQRSSRATYLVEIEDAEAVDKLMVIERLYVVRPAGAPEYAAWLPASLVGLQLRKMEECYGRIVLGIQEQRPLFGSDLEPASIEDLIV